MTEDDLTEQIKPAVMLRAISAVEEAASDPVLAQKVMLANQAVRAHINSCSRCSRVMRSGYSVRKGTIPNRDALCKQGYELMMALGRLAFTGDL